MRLGQVMGRKGVVWLKVPVTKNRPRGLCAHPPTPPDWEQGGEKAGATTGVDSDPSGTGTYQGQCPGGPLDGFQPDHLTVEQLQDLLARVGLPVRQPSQGLGAGQGTRPTFL